MGVAPSPRIREARPSDRERLGIDKAGAPPAGDPVWTVWVAEGTDAFSVVGVPQHHKDQVFIRAIVGESDRGRKALIRDAILMARDANVSCRTHTDPRRAPAWLEDLLFSNGFEDCGVASAGTENPELQLALGQGTIDWIHRSTVKKQ